MANFFEELEAQSKYKAEEWRAIAGYEGIYEVSDQGRVRSLDRIGADGRRWTSKLLKLGQYPSGHLYVGLFRDGKQKIFQVHRLVLEAFVGPCPEGMECCHGEGGPGDNRRENLRWDTHSSNMRDRRRDGTDANVNKTHCIRGHLLEEWNLRTSELQKGYRVCLSCDRAWSRIDHDPKLRPQLGELSNRYYSILLKERSEVPTGLS